MGELALDVHVPLRDFALRLALRLGAEPVALVGPSGAGKSTVLRAVAGLVRPAAGRIALGEEVWLDRTAGIDLPPERRAVGMLFQDHALFPHLTVERNIAFGRPEPSAATVRGLMERLRIGHLAGERPRVLSGGERQRVALARALARRPRVLLLDEPTAALDAETRAEVRAELAGLIGELGLPTLVVTHDFEEAASLVVRVGVLVRGRVLQLGTPAELVAAPADPFVARFTGANLLRGLARPGADGLTEVVLHGGGVVRSTDPGRGPVAAAVHPWEVSIARGQVPGAGGAGGGMRSDSAQNHVTGAISAVVPLGNRLRVTVAGLTAEITAASGARLGLRPGEVVVAGFKATATRLVPAAPPARPPGPG